MLYMTVLSWEPDKRDAVIERVRKIGLQHEGMKVVGTWIDPAGGRSFQLIDAPDQADFARSLKATMAWSDLAKMEHIQVVEASEMMKFLESIR